MRLHTHSSTRTELTEVGRKIARYLRGGEVIALSGELGAGKTTLVQGIADGLGVEKEVISPTFVLERRYPLDKSGERELVHVDFYRMKDAEETNSIGLKEAMADPGFITCIEWAEKFPEILPEERLNITLNEDGGGRGLEFSAKGERYEVLIRQVGEEL